MEQFRGEHIRDEMVKTLQNVNTEVEFIKVLNAISMSHFRAATETILEQQQEKESGKDDKS